MRRTPRQFCDMPATSRPATALPCGRHILPLLLKAIGRPSGQGEQLEPRIVSHSDRRRIGCARSRCCRMRGGEQCDFGPGVRPGRAAVQDHVRHDQRRADHRPLHRTVWSTPTAACARNGCCLSAAGHGPAHHSGSAGPAISSRDASRSGGRRGSAEPAVSSPDHDSQSDAATRLCPACARPARTGAGRSATGAACASAGAGCTDRLRHHRQRADHRSLHHDLRVQAQRWPIGLLR